MTRVSAQRGRIIRRARWAVPLLALAGIFWLVHVLASRGPRPPQAAPAAPRLALSAAHRQMDADISSVEADYRAAQREGRLAPDWEEKLARAVEWQREILASNRSPGGEHAERLEKLETARDSLAAERINARSRALAEAAEAEQDEAAALAGWREALALQLQVNRSRADPRQKDFARETRLSMLIESLEAAPLRRVVDEAVAEAEAAREQADWPAALRAYQRAGETLTELNRRFPRTRFADLRLQMRVEEQVAALAPAAAAEEIAERERAGEAAVAAGRPDLATTLFAAALEQQAELNRRFPLTRFASTARLQELETKHQTAMAAEDQARARLLDEELCRGLSQRRLVAAGRSLAKLTALLEAIAARYPRSSAAETELRLKAAYLNRQWDHLAALHEECYGMLLPLPGERGLLLGRRQTPQGLFARVMASNPSRHRDDAAPVDFVDWNEAAEFCRRLTWLMGRPVRLPREAEVRAALAWREVGNEAHNRVPSAVPATGFLELAGDSTEWLEAGPDDAAAPIFGGSPAAALARLGPKQNREARLGFRFVVELPD
ncbi:MAG: SUMF1/EgtB/PvdO family nonheme iron enzyme [Opitutaceae bacterium]|nr:SUMF1/EgtB/PvdO family nonheme iron enzyme [Opitutaceae bacterium]